MGDRNQPLCTLVADDLTGACDAAVQFAAFGHSATALLDWSLIGDCSSDVIAATTESRADAPADAAEKVAVLAGLLRRKQSRLVFKKVDSVLRGNLGSEIEASLKAFDCEVCMIAPSFPSLGRRISGGWLTTASCDAAPTVHLPTLLERQGMTALVHIEGAGSAGGIGSLAERLKDERSKGKRCFTFDAVSDSALDAVIAAAGSLGRRVLWVGSAGLARRLAEHSVGCGDGRVVRRPGPGNMTEGRTAVLLAIGSDHPVTLRQIDDLAACREVVTVRPGAADAKRAMQALRRGCAVILRVEPGRTAAEDLRGFLAGMEFPHTQGLVLSGGDTASLVCAALGAGSIRLEGEIATGIPWGTIGGGTAHGVPAATKSGGFGASDALSRAVDFLSRCIQNPEA